MKLDLAATTFALAGFTVGCYSWRPLAVEPREALSHPPSVARLELQDGRTVTLGYIKVERDTVFGVPRSGHERIREPIADVRRVVVSQPDPRRTRYAVAGATAVGVGVLAVIIAETVKTPKPIDVCSQLPICDF